MLVKAGKLLAEIGGKADNAAWLYGKLRKGYTVIDVGVDFCREKRSSSYAMEKIILRIWDNRTLIKMCLDCSPFSN